MASRPDHDQRARQIAEQAVQIRNDIRELHEYVARMQKRIEELEDFLRLEVLSNGACSTYDWDDGSYTCEFNLPDGQCVRRAIALDMPEVLSVSLDELQTRGTA